MKIRIPVVAFVAAAVMFACNSGSPGGPQDGNPPPGSGSGTTGNGSGSNGSGNAVIDGGNGSPGNGNGNGNGNDGDGGNGDQGNDGGDSQNLGTDGGYAPGSQGFMAPCHTSADCSGTGAICHDYTGKAEMLCTMSCTSAAQCPAPSTGCSPMAHVCAAG
jgi:hypothetical protein